MSSTEQKNIAQPLISACRSHGILAVLCSGAFGDFALETHSLPFEGIGATSNLLRRVLASDDPARELRQVLPVLDGCRTFARSSPFILKVATDSKVLVGNQAVMFLYSAQLQSRGSLNVRDTRAINHAKRNTARLCGYLGAGSYINPHRAERNARHLERVGDANRLRSAADAFAKLNASRPYTKHHRQIRSWCTDARQQLSLGSHYYRASAAIEAYLSIDESVVRSLPELPELRVKELKTARQGPHDYKFRHFDNHYYVEVTDRYHEPGAFRLTSRSEDGSRREARQEERSSSIQCVLSHRDIEDLVYLLTAASAILTYFRRRLQDVRGAVRLKLVSSVHVELWELYKSVVRGCSRRWDLRNKLGVYFDVLQWRYLAKQSGDRFYNHSRIMGAKIQSKGLTSLPSQDAILNRLYQLPPDIAIDLLGIYKASIYPEVDPFKVVAEQYRLHFSRHDTNWQDGSPEKQRFDETRAYMWYLGVRVLNQRFNVWCGSIRAGVTQKPWHARYKQDGIPSESWRDSHDVDLTDAVPVQDISDEQYMRQQDSACAPPYQREFASYKAMLDAPRRHKRKILYTIQEPDPPSLVKAMNLLNTYGSTLPEGYIGPVDIKLPFSTDIVTGSRCERHKDAPRPFYAASSPWGCILSYIDGITRDFLSHVPQSMMGKSTRQKFTDLNSVTIDSIMHDYTFYMSDDKAKYSPHMDSSSQQLPADFFAEVFGLPGIKTCGPIMYHNNLFYRVHGHLVHYNSNGTDREGMRGAANTWLEVVAQGLSTRLCRERRLVKGKSQFLSFIDDGLRKFNVETSGRTPQQCEEAAREVIQDVIFGLRVLGRELSWDKTFISRDLFVMLNEINFKKSFVSSGLKSYCTIGDIELKEVMAAPDYEQLYFGKLRGAHGVGCPIDLCHYTYVFEVLVSHARMGFESQDCAHIGVLDYRLFCMTPVAMGGAGLRTMLQMSCNEVADATREGIGTLLRLAKDIADLTPCVQAILNQEMQPLDPLDFMREPEQFHVPSPRLKTQRMAAEVRKRIQGIASNRIANKYVELDAAGQEFLRNEGRLLMSLGNVSAEEIRLLYASNPVAFVDNFIQKLVSSSTISELLGRDSVRRMRSMVRRDLIQALDAFPTRCNSEAVYAEMRSELGKISRIWDFIVK